MAYLVDAKEDAWVALVNAISAQARAEGLDSRYNDPMKTRAFHCGQGQNHELGCMHCNIGPATSSIISLSTGSWVLPSSSYGS